MVKRLEKLGVRIPLSAHCFYLFSVYKIIINYERTEERGRVGKTRND